MKNRDSIIKTVLDMGSGKIKAIIGKLSPDGNDLTVLHYSEVLSRGIEKGEVRNDELLRDDLATVFSDLNQSIGRVIDSVTIGISGDKIKSRTLNVEVSFDETEITEKEVKLLISSAKEKIGNLDTTKFLKVEIYNIKIDNSGIVKNPIGILGSKLQADIHLISVEKSYIDKLVEIINSLSVNVENIVLNAYASVLSTLEGEDRVKGVALVDVGEGTTDIILYKNDKLIYTESIPLGGMHFKGDIKYIFKLSDDIEASEVLDKFRNNEISQDGYIHYGVEGKRIDVEELKRVLNARVDEIIEFINSTIQKSGFKGYLGKGLVLTGGVASDKIINTNKFLDKISSKTGYLAKVSFPRVLNGFIEVKTSMATVIGLICEVMEEERRKLENENYVKQQVEVQNKIEQPKKEQEESYEPFEEEEENENEKEKSGLFSWVSNWLKHLF